MRDALSRPVFACVCVRVQTLGSAFLKSCGVLESNLETMLDRTFLSLFYSVACVVALVMSYVYVVFCNISSCRRVLGQS